MIQLIQKYALSLLGGALLLSLVGNGVQYLQIQHYKNKSVVCVEAVKSVNVAATKTKAVVEKRNVRNAEKVQTDVTARIANATRKLHDNQSRERDMPEVAGGPVSPDSASPTPKLLSELEDERICVVNTILVEGWQEFYAKMKEIENDETNPESSSLPSP